jgi:hypothetical protein
MSDSALFRRFPRPDVPFLLLLALVVAVNLPVSTFVLQNDTKEGMQYFYSFYNEFVQHGQIQLWDPYFYFGLSIDLRQLNTLSYAASLAAICGKLLHVSNAFLVYKAAIILEQFVYVTGMYLLAKRMTRDRRAVLFVGLCAALTNVWHLQVWFDFRTYALLPLTLYALLRFFDDAKPWRLFAAALVYLVSALGSTGYFVSMFAPVLLVYALGLFWLRRKEVAAKWRTRALFSPASLALELLVLATALVFLDYIRHMLDGITVAGYAGRDPLTGTASLDSYLHTLSAPDKAMQSFWELLLAAPRDWIFTVYAGIFALVFSLYAVIRRRDAPTPALLPLCGCAALCAAMALGSLTIVAPALYYLWPMMNKTRYLLAFLGPLKMLLILIAGIGVDVFLADLADAAAEGRRRARLAGWLALGLCALAAVVDLAFGGKFPYPAEGFVPYAYHFVPMALAAGFALFLLSAERPGRGLVWALLALAAVDVASYLFFFLFHFNLEASYYKDREVLNKPYLTEREYRARLREAGDFYDVRPYAYQPTRIPMAQLRYRDPAAWRAMQNFRFAYADYMNVFYRDVCDPTAHRAHFSQGLGRLQQALLGLDLDEPLHDVSPWLMESVVDPQRFLGCARPKAYLTQDAFLATDLGEAAQYLHEVHNADQRPVMLPESTAFAAKDASGASGTSGRQRPTVFVCPEGNCQEGAVGKPAFWDKLLAAYPGRFAPVLFAYPRERETAWYRLRAAGPEDAGLMPRAWRLEGSDDCVSWTLLDQRRDAAPWKGNEQRDYRLEKPARYRYYLLSVDEGATPGRLSLGETTLRRYPDELPVSGPDLPVAVTDYTVNGLTLRADVPPGPDRWLVYLDNADPGWRAFVDGAPAPLYVANLAFKAVKLPPGAHEVRLTYVGKGRNALYLRYFLALGAAFGLWGVWLIGRTALCASARPARQV